MGGNDKEDLIFFFLDGMGKDQTSHDEGSSIRKQLDIEKATRCVEPWVLHATEELLNTAPETKDAPYVG